MPGDDRSPAVTATMPGCPVHAAALPDLVDARLYSDGDPHAVWRRLRALDHLSWQAVDDRRGFWSVVSFRDADLVLRDHEAFTSERGTLLNLLGKDDPAGGRQIAATDPPRHTRMRAHLAKALAMKSVDRQRELIRELVVELLEPLATDGAIDFAEAMQWLPMAVSGKLMALPRADWSWLNRQLVACIAPADPEFRLADGDEESTLEIAHRELFAYFQDVVRSRSRRLGDDLVSVLITTEFEGRRMSLGEVVSNCYSLLLGATVTTPHAPNYLMAELIDRGVFEEWAADLEVTPTAVEESLRLASPVHHFLRHATRDVEVGGTLVAAGDPVVVWLGSANRDARAFDDPDGCDLRRKPNRHLAFGAGPHYCVGHTVARVTLRVLFDELLAGFTGFEPAGPPQRLRSNFVAGYKHVPITARPVVGARR